MEMLERSRSEPNAFARRLFSPLPARYDLLGWILSFGQDRRWRSAAARKLSTGTGDMVLDVATGPAGVAFAIQRRTGSRVVGVDLNEPMLQRAASNVARRAKGGQVTLAAARGEELPFRDETFDGLCFSYLMRYVSDPAATIAELARVVRPGGVVTSFEFHVPESPLWWPLWWFYTRLLLPLGGAALGGRPWYEVGRFLGPSISEHYRRYPLDWTLRAWRDAGLVNVSSSKMSLGGGVVIWGWRGPRRGS